MPKKGKKELEKEKQLEEERLRLEEEARLAKEKADREREIAETKNREAIESLIKNDSERLENESLEVSQLYESKATELAMIVDQIAKNIEWTAYLSCPFLPNPKAENDVMSFLTAWAEQEFEESENYGEAFAAFFKEFPNADALAIQLEFERCLQMGAKNDKKVEAIRDQICRLRDILFAKCDYMTSIVLHHMDYYNTEPAENFFVTKVVKQHSIGLWGNLTKNPRYKSIDLTEGHISMSIPKHLTLASVAIRVMLENGLEAATPFDVQETNRHMSVVGGILYLDLVELPETAKLVEKWTIRPMISSNYQLRRMPYPFQKASTDQGEEKEDPNSDLFSWSTLVHYPLLKGCVVDKRSAKVMRWNYKKDCWDDENITDTDYDYEAGKVRFRTPYFAPTALVQNTYGEFPLQDWSLSPKDAQSSILTIKGISAQISIEIEGGKCRLLSPTLDTIKDVTDSPWVPPSYLFKRLSQYGYNFKAPTSLKGVEIDDWILKNPKSEESCNRGIALCSPCFELRMSPYNRSLSSSKCAFMFREILPESQRQAMVQKVLELIQAQSSIPATGQEGNPVSDGGEPPVPVSTRDPTLEELGWKTLLFDSDFKVGDSTKELAFVTPPGPITNTTRFQVDSVTENNTIRSSAYHVLRSSITQDSNEEKLGHFSALYTETLYQILTLTRVIGFS